MRKIKGVILAIVIVIAVMIVAGCGASAYDVAVQNGFSGTEQEWLASLKGVDGNNLSAKDVYEEAKINGFSGTYLDFVKEYFTFEVGEDNSASIAIALRSAVVVYCQFGSTGYFGSQNAYGQGGAGVIYRLNKTDGSAYIITNYHVVYGSNSRAVSRNISVLPYGQTELITATFVGGSSQYDIAVLKCENDYFKSNFPEAIILPEKSDVSVGQTAIAIGNPEGAGISVTQGIISVESEYIDMNDIVTPSASVSMRVIRVDAAVNSGNSGGGLFDAYGQLIGIVNAKSADSSNENMSYAIPATIASGVADNIIRNNGTFKKGTIGIGLQDENISVFIGQDNLVKITSDATVMTVEGAAAGKLEVGDIIRAVTIGDKTIEVTRMFHVIDAVLTTTPGDTVVFKIDRQGTDLDVSVICG